MSATRPSRAEMCSTSWRCTAGGDEEESLLLLGGTCCSVGLMISVSLSCCVALKGAAVPAEAAVEVVAASTSFAADALAEAVVEAGCASTTVFAADALAVEAAVGVSLSVFCSAG